MYWLYIFFQWPNIWELKLIVKNDNIYNNVVEKENDFKETKTAIENKKKLKKIQGKKLKTKKNNSLLLFFFKKTFKK